MVVRFFRFFFSSRRRHTRSLCDWSSDVCSSDLQRASRQRCRYRQRQPCRARPRGRKPRSPRSEERRVGKECRSRWSPYHYKQKKRTVYAPDHDVVYPGQTDLTQYLFKTLAASGFDLTDLIAWPPNTWMLFFSSRRRHTRSLCDWISDVCSSDLLRQQPHRRAHEEIPGISGVGRAELASL